MPFKKMHRYALEDGFCCLWAMLTLRRKYPTRDMSEESGMTPRAIRYWKAKLRNNELSCPSVCTANCMKKEIMARQKSS